MKNKPINIYTERLEQFGKHLMSTASPPANYIVPARFVILEEGEVPQGFDVIYIHNALEELVDVFDQFYIDDETELYYRDQKEGVIDGLDGALKHFNLTAPEFSYMFKIDDLGTYRKIYGGNLISKNSSYQQIAENILLVVEFRNRMEGIK